MGFLSPYHHHFAKGCADAGYDERIFWEDWVKHARTARIIYDAGGYSGLYGLLAAATNPNAKVYIFEVEPEALKHIELNIKLNSLSNIIIIESALWDEDGTVLFNGIVGGTAGRIDDHGYTVNSISFNTICGRVGAPDLMKLDIEGAEYRVIKSMKVNPKMLVEVHLKLLVDGTKQDLLDELKSRKYELMLVGQWGHRYHKKNDPFREHYWCIPSG